MMSNLSRIGFSSLFAFLLFPWPAASQTLRLQFGFEDAGAITTDSVAGVTLNLVDASGASANLHGTGGSGVGGMGKALDFASAPGVSGVPAPMAFVTGNPALGLGVIAQFTLTQWINPAQLSAYPRFFLLGTNSVDIETDGDSLGYLLNNGASFQAFVDGFQRNTPTIVPGLAVGDWSFVAITYDGTNVVLWAGSETSAVVAISTNVLAGLTVDLGVSGSLFLGNRGDQLRGFKGLIDDTRLYTGAADATFLDGVRQAALPALFASPTTISPSTAPLGATVVVKSTAGGVPPLYYRWRFTDTNGVSTLIPGATNATYVISEAQYSDAGVYSLILSNNSGSPAVITNDGALLSIIPLNGVELQNLGDNVPMPGEYDLAQLGTAGNTMFPPTGSQATGLNYYTDNALPPGQTFTTGLNTNGYLLTSLFIKWGGIEGSHVSGNPYTLRLYSIVGNTATLLSTYTNNNVAAAMAPGDWTKWIGLSNQLAPNSTYAYSVSARSPDFTAGVGYMQVGNASGDPFAGGQIALIPANGGPVTFGVTGDYDGTFLVHLSSSGGATEQIPRTNGFGPFLNDVMPEVAPAVPPNWITVPAFPNLYFTNALGLMPVPGTNLLCVIEREGRVWTFVSNSNTTTKTLVLDISNQCQGWDDSGLLNLAFHPGFATNGYLYLYYTYVTPGTVVGSPTQRPTEMVVGKYHDRLSRFTVSNGVSSLATELVLVDQTGDSVWHNGSGLFFHPDNGFLYWTDGDDERQQTQTITNKLLSGVFRIDVDMRGGAISHPIPRQPALGVTANYYIPNDNPFVGQANVLEEFYCLGLRSPHRMTIDPPTGRIFIGDVGAGSREEISVIEPGEAGLNFQWSVIEGLNGDLTPPYVGINRRPILDYPRSDGQAVIGGYVYRGSEFAAELGGRYIFGDNVRGTIWVMDESTTPASKQAIATLPKGSGPNTGSDYTGLSSFGLDANNELYLCQMSSVGGQIFKLARGAPVASRPLPTLLSQTGAFTNLAALSPASGLLPYNVNSPLWSDAAIKSRWMALPTNGFINFAATGEWSFPIGTVFVKHFQLATNDLDPSQTRRLETRLLVIGTNGLAYGAGYKWRADNSDADLVQTMTNETITITTATGTRTQVWSYPGRADCLICHTIPAGGVLGVKTRQLNGDFDYEGGAVNQLHAWSQSGLFSIPINEPDIPNYSRLSALSDTNAPLATRVRSYWDANCAHCHRPGGGVQANFDARFDTPLASQGIIYGPVQNNQGIPNALVVAPGDLAHSLLYIRDNAVGAPLQMPPLAKNMIDTNYIAVLGEWINSLVPPTVSPIADVMVSPGGSTGPIPFTVGDASVPVTALTVAGTSSRQALVPDGNILLGGSGANRTVTVTPIAGQFGSATITLQVDNGSAPAFESFVVTVPGDLVGWYKFEGDTADSSGHGNQGTAGGTVSYVAGKVGATAMSFDGSSGYVQIPRSVSNDFTLTLWVKTTDTAGGSQWWAGKGLLDGEMAGTGSDFGTALVGAKAAFGVGAPDTTILSTSSINDGDWHHVAATRDSISGEIKLYVDGVLENSQITTATGPRLPTNLRIGSIRSGVSAGFLNGTIDDARIYNYTMNGNEVAALLNVPPVLAPISDQTIVAGAVLTITNSATDASVPSQTLTYSMTGPVGANLNPSNGIFTWRPSIAQGGTTNPVLVQVSDDGTPSMSASQTFSVIVIQPAWPVFSGAVFTNNHLWLSITGDVGPDYTVLASTNLIDWAQLLTTNQPAMPFLFMDPEQTNFSRRFYRVLLGP